jgi:hypothetical protein
LRDALACGGAASLASTVALLAYGARECDDPAVPLNGPSQWIWGRHAPYRSGFSWRYTFVGFLVHHFASTFWGAIYHAARGAHPNSARDARAAIGVSALACLVDYRLTPERLTPGFQNRLSRGALLGIYTAFAAGLAIGARAARPPSRRASR